MQKRVSIDENVVFISDILIVKVYLKKKKNIEWNINEWFLLWSPIIVPGTGSWQPTSF